MENNIPQLLGMFDLEPSFLESTLLNDMGDGGEGFEMHVAAIPCAADREYRFDGGVRFGPGDTLQASNEKYVKFVFPRNDKMRYGHEIR